MSQPPLNPKAKPKDPVFKRLIQTYFEEAHLTDTFTVTPGLQVGQLQLEIDLAISAADPSLNMTDLQTRLANTPFWFFSRYNLLEFKSLSDPLDESDFARITARSLLAWADRPEASRAEMLSCIISAAWPREFLKKIKPGGQSFKKIKPGIYRHAGFLFPIYLIVCNQLPIEEINYPLLVFSGGEKLKAFLLQIAVDTGMEMYLNYAVRLHPVLTAEILTSKGGGMTKAEEKRIAEVVYDVLGPERLAEMIDPEQLLKILGPERLVELLTKNLGIELTPEQREQLKRKLEAKESQSPNN